jgi:DNA polymerase III alpha subunit
MQILNDEQVGIEMLYRNKSIQDVPFLEEVVKRYNSVCEELNIIPITSEGNWSKEFNIPLHYKELDVEDYVRRLVSSRVDGTDNAESSQRVEMELAEFNARNLYPVLQLLIYIIDTMRKNNLIWGVGRGSSVASYVLFLLGIHKVDSIKYNLDIREFLK